MVTVEFTGENFNAFISRLDKTMLLLFSSKMISPNDSSKSKVTLISFSLNSGTNASATSVSQGLILCFEKCNSSLPSSIFRTSSTISITCFICLVCLKMFFNSVSAFSGVTFFSISRFSGVYIKVRGVRSSWLILIRNLIFSSFSLFSCSFNCHLSFSSFLLSCFFIAYNTTLATSIDKSMTNQKLFHQGVATTISNRFSAGDHSPLWVLHDT